MSTIKTMKNLLFNLGLATLFTHELDVVTKLEPKNA